MSSSVAGSILENTRGRAAVYLAQLRSEGAFHGGGAEKQLGLPETGRALVESIDRVAAGSGRMTSLKLWRKG